MNTTPFSDAADSGMPSGLVLYVEDDPITFAVVEAQLAAHPAVRLIHAHTAGEGVALARSAHPDVILLDMHLPDMSGIEVVRRLSEDIAANAFRVVLLTADSLNIDVIKAMSLGASEYLIKPVAPRVLDAAVGRALTAKARQQARMTGDRRS